MASIEDLQLEGIVSDNVHANFVFEAVASTKSEAELVEAVGAEMRSQENSQVLPFRVVRAIPIGARCNPHCMARELESPASAMGRFSSVLTVMVV